MCTTEPFLLPLLSTENTELIIHGCQYSRPEKTVIVSKNPLTHKFLDICINDEHLLRSNSKILNCSKCFKCLRTMVTLEHFNLLDLYTDVFDLGIYRSNKDDYISNLNENDPMEREILEIIK